MWARAIRTVHRLRDRVQAGLYIVCSYIDCALLVVVHGLHPATHMHAGLRCTLAFGIDFLQRSTASVLPTCLNIIRGGSKLGCPLWTGLLQIRQPNMYSTVTKLSSRPIYVCMYPMVPTCRERTEVEGLCTATLLACPHSA